MQFKPRAHSYIPLQGKETIELHLKMAPLDLQMIDNLGRELHPAHTGLMSEEEVCPWTLFLTMALTLLKGVLPHVPRMLPVLVQDPELRERAAETFMSEEFKDNIEEYFVQNIKVSDTYMHVQWNIG